MPKQYTFPRSGKGPLVFKGEPLAEVKGVNRKGVERWQHLGLYRTAAGAYVLTINYASDWKGESPYDLARVFKQPAEVIKFLEDYDPLACVRGYPKNDHYQERQAELVKNMRAQYKAQVAELLACAAEFSETVE